MLLDPKSGLHFIEPDIKRRRIEERKLLISVELMCCINSRLRLSFKSLSGITSNPGPSVSAGEPTAFLPSPSQSAPDSSPVPDPGNAQLSESLPRPAASAIISADTQASASAPQLRRLDDTQASSSSANARAQPAPFVSRDPLMGVIERLLEQLLGEIEAWHTMLSAKGTLRDMVDRSQRHLIPPFDVEKSFLPQLHIVADILFTLDNAYTSSSGFGERLKGLLVVIPRERLLRHLQILDRLEERRTRILTTMVAILTPFEIWLSQPSAGLSRTLNEVGLQIINLFELIRFSR